MLPRVSRRPRPFSTSSSPAPLWFLSAQSPPWTASRSCSSPASSCFSLWVV